MDCFSFFLFLLHLWAWHRFTKSSGIFYPLFFSFQFFQSTLLVWWIIRWIYEMIIFGLSVERMGSLILQHTNCPCWSMCWTTFFSSILLFPYCIPCPYASLSLFLILYLFARGETMHRDMTATQYKALSFIFDSFWNTFRYDSFKTYLHVSV